ncbi:helix-turn-helix domain-containing protein [Photobacterium carnosum]|uniref:HTH cro/C1-type domain-containing protein n=1 Tax=Photobacterium carnosum TaxID=2023717 RepID=A0A2N4UWB4_9GAMM|nr:MULTISPECIES: helix-turn-helix domain-containing protein [Photobacterium]MCD9477228.1 helix-turn-helix domain-containing protein [Photobacterium phosphoreum]MCD9485953.1 helix-turn-helix domain-containing protein [Photobacterium iliopiscarium]MCD9508785.1 helix-turn-helix domain-containing protein [Photobacterium phosphoreum]MCD9539318.1 helix-turn-helix domain-containing protein [Photobacterium carnosum]MCD9543037.1 helix-turn-helix domain-containing protein [Photobacterium carnosum]
MNYSHMTPSALAELMGDRIKQYRLNCNKSQDDIAMIAGVTRQRIARAEAGKATMETFMALMLALDATDYIDSFLPPTPISPIQLSKLKGKERVRASSSRTIGDNATQQEDDLGW